MLDHENEHGQDRSVFPPLPSRQLPRRTGGRAATETADVVKIELRTDASSVWGKASIFVRERLLGQARNTRCARGTARTDKALCIGRRRPPSRGLSQQRPCRASPASQLMLQVLFRTLFVEIGAPPCVAGISSLMPSVAMSQSKSGAFQMHR